MRPSQSPIPGSINARAHPKVKSLDALNGRAHSRVVSPGENSRTHHVPGCHKLTRPTQSRVYTGCAKTDTPIAELFSQPPPFLPYHPHASPLTPTAFPDSAHRTYPLPRRRTCRHIPGCAKTNAPIAELSHLSSDASERYSRSSLSSDQDQDSLDYSLEEEDEHVPNGLGGAGAPGRLPGGGGGGSDHSLAEEDEEETEEAESPVSRKPPAR